jgi:hypothetical protein
MASSSGRELTEEEVKKTHLSLTIRFYHSKEEIINDIDKIFMEADVPRITDKNLPLTPAPSPRKKINVSPEKLVQESISVLHSLLRQDPGQHCKTERNSLLDRLQQIPGGVQETMEGLHMGVEDLNIDSGWLPSC